MSDSVDELQLVIGYVNPPELRVDVVSVALAVVGQMPDRAPLPHLGHGASGALAAFRYSLPSGSLGRRSSVNEGIVAAGGRGRGAYRSGLEPNTGTSSSSAVEVDVLLLLLIVETKMNSNRSNHCGMR